MMVVLVDLNVVDLGEGGPSVCSGRDGLTVRRLRPGNGGVRPGFRDALAVRQRVRDSGPAIHRLKANGVTGLPTDESSELCPSFSRQRG